ncbi:MAG: SRPBCC domain-containing protein [Marmoricola sp.]
MSSRRDSASRVIHAEASRIFGALITAESLVQWLPPRGMSGRFERFDARPGGSYRMVLTYDDGSSEAGKSSPGSDVVEGRFVEIVPDLRVVQQVAFDSADPAFTGTMTMTWELSREDGATRVQVSADHVPRGIGAEDHVAGMSSSLANLEVFVESA